MLGRVPPRHGGGKLVGAFCVFQSILSLGSIRIELMDRLSGGVLRGERSAPHVLGQRGPRLRREYNISVLT